MQKAPATPAPRAPRPPLPVDSNVKATVRSPGLAPPAPWTGPIPAHRPDQPAASQHPTTMPTMPGPKTNQPVPPPARDPRPRSAAPVTPPKTPAVPQPAPGPMDPQPLLQPPRPHRPNWRPRETQGWQNRWLLLASCVTRGDLGGAQRHIQQWRGHCPYFNRHLQAVQENGWDWEFNPP